MTMPLLRLAEQELAVRSARKDGRQVVSLRSVARDGGFVVECEVYPVSGLAIDPIVAGPYTFATSEEASFFVEDALAALTHLGCEVA